MTAPHETRSERLADGAIHVLGVAASLVATAVLMVFVIASRDALAIASAAVYGIGLLATFGFSAAYNLAVRPERKEAIRRFDHAAIFLMIAGTCTPFALAGSGRATGSVLLPAVWSIAAAGALLKLLAPRRFERGSVALYLVLGWLGLVAAGPLTDAVPAPAAVLLGAGAILYTVGVGFYLWRTLPWHNALWHALVLAAAGCHYVAVFLVLAAA